MKKTNLTVTVTVLFLTSASLLIFSVQRAYRHTKESAAFLEERLAHTQDQVAILQQQVANLQQRVAGPAPAARTTLPTGDSSALPAQAQSAGKRATGIIPSITAGGTQVKNISALDSKRNRYGPFLKERNLAPQHIDRVLQLLIEQDNVRKDLQNAIREQGIAGNSEAVARLRNQLYEPITREMRAILGEDGYAAFGRYERTSFFREAFIAPMIPQFQAAHAPLSDAQVAGLVAVVMANHTPGRRSATDISGQPKIDWVSVREQSAAILTADQMRALQAAIDSQPSPSNK